MPVLHAHDAGSAEFADAAERRVRARRLDQQRWRNVTGAAITGGVTADSGVARWRADGLWTVRGRHRLDLPWCG
jgi:hypothetical protein